MHLICFNLNHDIINKKNVFKLNLKKVLQKIPKMHYLKSEKI